MGWSWSWSWSWWPPEPDFILANLSPVEKVKFIDGEGHLIIVRVVLKRHKVVRI